MRPAGQREQIKLVLEKKTHNQKQKTDFFKKKLTGIMSLSFQIQILCFVFLLCCFFFVCSLMFFAFVVFGFLLFVCSVFFWPYILSVVGLIRLAESQPQKWFPLIMSPRISEKRIEKERERKMERVIYSSFF